MKHPSEALLRELEKVARRPRVCLGYHDHWERLPNRRADKIYCSSRCFKRVWRQGVEAAPLMIIRAEAEYNERAFEDELADYREELAGKGNGRASA